MPSPTQPLPKPPHPSPENPSPILLKNLFTSLPNNFSDITWQPFRPGIEIHRLYTTENAGPAAALLRYAPGASVATHLHTGYEHILILQGSQLDRSGEHHPGSLIINPPGSFHTVFSPNGCTALVIWHKPVSFTDPQT